MVINVDVEAEEKNRTIKLAVQIEYGNRHTRTFVGMLGETPKMKMAGLVGSFQAGENNSMVA